MITELEFTTPAHTMLNIFVYAFWWNTSDSLWTSTPFRKWNGIQALKRRAIETERLLVAGSGKRRSGWQLSRRVRPGRYVGGVLEREAGDLSWRSFGLAMCIALVGGTFGAIHCFAWNASFPTHTALASLSHCGHRGTRRCVTTCSEGWAHLNHMECRANYRLRYLPVYCNCGHLCRGKDMSTCTRIPCAQGSAIWGLSNAFLDGVLATYLLFRADAMTSSDDHKLRT